MFKIIFLCVIIAAIEASPVNDEKTAIGNTNPGLIITPKSESSSSEKVDNSSDKPKADVVQAVNDKGTDLKSKDDLQKSEYGWGYRSWQNRGWNYPYYQSYYYPYSYSQYYYPSYYNAYDPSYYNSYDSYANHRENHPEHYYW